MKVIFSLTLLFLYTCSNNPQWQTLNPKNTSLKTNLIRQIFLEDDKISWVGTFGDGLYRIDSSKWEKVDPSFIGKYIFSLKKDLQGGLWVGTGNYGAYYLFNNKYKCSDIVEKIICCAMKVFSRQNNGKFSKTVVYLTYGQTKKTAFKYHAGDG